METIEALLQKEEWLGGLDTKLKLLMQASKYPGLTKIPDKEMLDSGACVNSL